MPCEASIAEVDLRQGGGAFGDQLAQPVQSGVVLLVTVPLHRHHQGGRIPGHRQDPERQFACAVQGKPQVHGGYASGARQEGWHLAEGVGDDFDTTLEVVAIEKPFIHGRDALLTPACQYMAQLLVLLE